MQRYVWFAMILSLCACNSHNRYEVIERSNVSDGFYVPVVLLHDGHKYSARCNDLKGTADPKVTEHCNLHVGQTVECQLFENRGVNGYDLICGRSRNNKGNLDTYGENELLFIDKEEN
ncbi:MAG: hypothetical protein WB421_21010 [Terriglobales bacterium]|jgi:hypothetical protein